jgi:asparagine synthetase B (glutamine-hydrolysing)
MSSQITPDLGGFALFGLVHNPNKLLENNLPKRLGALPVQVFNFGDAGAFFFYSSYGDVAESEEALVLKLGFVRSPTMSPLSAEQLLAQKVVSPTAIDHEAFRGNALVASFDKRKPAFSVFKSLFASPQLYYSVSEGGILCATGLRPLIAMMDRAELREDAIVSQFLFGAVLGPATHLRGVFRLFPGELLKWEAGGLSVELARDLRFGDENLQFEQADSRTLDILYDRFRGVIGAYIDAAERSGSGFGNLLSGGVDSSFLQLAINEETPGSPARSYSYAVRVPSFEYEIEYAKQAVSALGTEHTFIDVTEQEFPDLLINATCILGQPVLTMAEVCKLKLADSLSRIPGAPRFFFVAQGADTLFGLKISKKLKILEYLSRVPASEMVLALAGGCLRPFTRRGQTLLNLADILSHLDDLDHPNAPINTEATIPDLGLARSCFGDEAIQRALEGRREREAAYLDSDHYTEKVHVGELLGDGYEIEAQSTQLFLSRNKEQVYPFLDEDVIRLSFAFRPQVRYIKGQRNKYILKDLLEQRATTPISRQAKGGSMFHPDLHRWMQSGSLRDMVSEISPPGCLSRRDFDNLVANPSLVLWHLLAFDIFQKHVLAPAQQPTRGRATLELK